MKRLRTGSDDWRRGALWVTGPLAAYAPGSVILSLAVRSLLFGCVCTICEAATTISELRLLGLDNKIESDSELVVAERATLSGVRGSVIDFFHATVALPPGLTLTDFKVEGELNEVREGAALSLLEGAAFRAASGSTVDLSLASVQFPSSVVLTSSIQTLQGKTLINPVVSSMMSAPGENFVVAASNGGAAIILSTGTNAETVTTPNGSGLAIVNGVHVYGETLAKFNTFVGFDNGRRRGPSAAYNTAFGYYALADLTTGYANTAFGVQALFRNTTGTYNLGLGVEALVNNTTGLNNTAVGGYDTLFSNTIGSDNVGLGYAAGYKNVTGSSNVAIGSSAMYMNSSSSGIVAIGASAGYSNTGPFNTFVGALSGAYFDNTGYDSTGGENTFLGALAGASARTSSGNTFIGYLAGRDFTRGNNNIAIGANVALPSGVGDNQINLGDRLIGTVSGAVELVAGGSNAMISLTPSGGAPVSITGVSNMIGTARLLNRFVDIGSTQDNSVVGVNLGIFEGDRNSRAALFLDDASGIYGFNATASSGLPQFVIQNAGVTNLAIRPTGEALLTSTAVATRAGTGSFATAGGIYADKNIFAKGGITTPGRILAGEGLDGGANGLVLNSSLLSQAIAFRLGALEVARFSPTSGNLLLGGTIDIVGEGGLKVFGSTASTSPSTGAMQVVGGAGIGGALNVGGALSVAGSGSIGGDLMVLNTTASTSTTTGAFQVLGGVGIGGTLNVGGNGIFGAPLRIGSDAGSGNEITFSDRSNSTYYGTLGVAGSAASISAGAAPLDVVLRSQSNLRIAAGGPTDRLVIAGSDGAISITSSKASTSTTTGALVVAGGLGVAGDHYLGGSLSLPGNGTLSGSAGDLSLTVGGSDSSILLNPSGAGGVSVSGSLLVAGNQSTAGNLTLTALTPASSTTSGALSVAGGASIQKMLFLGDDLALVPVSASTSSVRLSGTAVADTPGLWFRDGGTPTAANVALAGTATETILNAPADGSLSLRIGDTGYVMVAPSAVTFTAAPLRVTSSSESVSTTTGSATFAGGIGVAGRTTTKTLTVGGGSAVDLIHTILTTLDFPSIAPNGGVQDLTVSFPGASIADDVRIVEAGGVFAPAGLVLRAIVNAPNTVTVRATNVTPAVIDPASIPFRVTVTSF